MNYFSHAIRFLDDPYFVAGVSVPDWLNVVDRKVRVRSKDALKFVDHQNQDFAAVAKGIVQHHFDDDWFHKSRIFTELNLKLAEGFRTYLPEEAGFRPSFLGHILVEILIDSELIARHPDKLEQYYDVLNQIKGEVVQEVVNSLAKNQTDRLALLIPRFCTERFLADYAEDRQLLRRLNQVMKRVTLPPLPDSFLDGLVWARSEVLPHVDQLLEGMEIDGESLQ